MCGISGIYRFDGKGVPEAGLLAMRDSMVHRGPDDCGLYIDGSVGLAHNRLSVLDLSALGHQPMVDPESGCRIVYNGEIYNFRELKQELTAEGRDFRSECDTEVILHAYRVWGEQCLERLNGMFAFAIFDPANEDLFIARDRVGIKPLYYFLDDRQFVFASELKALLKAPGVTRSIDRDAIPELLAFRYLAGGRTLLENVREVSPAHSARISPSGMKSRRYWEISATDPRTRTPAEWLEGFEDTLRSSVACRLVADVPVGCALSGGIDSSLVTAMAVEASTSEMQCFTIGYEDRSSDERPFALEVAEQLEIENFSRTLTEETFFGELSRLAWHMDEPINHPNSVGIWLLARLAREKVTVLLTGEGGDELMGGYDRFRTILSMRRKQRIPGVSLLARLIPAGVRSARYQRLRELTEDPDRLMIWSSAYLPRRSIEQMFGEEGVEKAEARRRELLQANPFAAPLDRHLHYEFQTYLRSLLTRVDKMCMAVSLENRVPLLDHRLVEYAFSMPTELKVDSTQGKIALRRLAERRFKPGLFERKKKGFGVPGEFFRERGLDYVRSLVSSDSFRGRGLLDEDRMTRLLDAYENGASISPDSIWTFSSLELWARTFVDRPGERVS